MISKTHYYFGLNTSPWPVIISVSSFNLFLSFLIFMKFSLTSYFFLSLIITSLFSFFWWVNYSSEFNLEGKNSFSLEIGIKISMILFISSEVFFFFSFFWTYFHFFLNPSLELGLSWPPMNVEFFDFLGVPLINTLVLMSSGFTVTVSHSYLLDGKMKKASFWLMSSVMLGLLFSILQYSEYKNSFFSISDSSFGTSFFMLTGFHGIHVIIGSIFLLVSLIRFMILSSSTMNSLSFELSSWYWHFVDVVWIFLYCFLYYLSN